MRISDDQRREVATNLRRLDDETCALIDERMYRLTNEELAGNAVLNIGLCIAMYGAGFDTMTLGGFWDLLADLIDRPTCKNLATKSADELLCSECGEHVDIAYMENADDYHARYCPNCGAMVVTDDE